tara:strand:+ start:201 stop:419 length:219 start_codon:yes stop_codon:yes gene_type:complete
MTKQNKLTLSQLINNKKRQEKDKKKTEKTKTERLDKFPIEVKKMKIQNEITIIYTTFINNIYYTPVETLVQL